MKPIVYIIDDNFVSEFATRMVLEQSKIYCKIISFEEGKRALSSLSSAIRNKENIPDIILLDLKMPVMDGWEFLKGISEIHLSGQKIAIYMLSTFASADTRKRVLSHPLVKGYYERPLSTSNIESMMSILADRPKTY